MDIKPQSNTYRVSTKNKNNFIIFYDKSMIFPLIQSFPLPSYTNKVKSPPFITNMQCDINDQSQKLKSKCDCSIITNIANGVEDIATI